MLHQVTAVALALLAASPASAPAAQDPFQVGSTVGTLSIADQFDHVWNVSPIPGNVRVLVFTSAPALAATDRWMGALQAQFGTRLSLLRVLDAQSFGAMSRGMLQHSLQGQPPIGVDWDGALGRQFGYTAGDVMLALIDEDGVLRHVTVGPPTLENYGAFTLAVAQASKAFARAS